MKTILFFISSLLITSSLLAQLNDEEVRKVLNLDIGAKQYDVSIKGTFSTSLTKTSSLNASGYSMTKNEKTAQKVDLIFKGTAFGFVISPTDELNIKAHKYKVSEDHPPPIKLNSGIDKEYLNTMLKVAKLNGLQECWIRVNGLGTEETNANSAENHSSGESHTSTSSQKTNIIVKLTDFNFKYTPATKYGKEKWNIQASFQFKGRSEVKGFDEDLDPKTPGRYEGSGEVEYTYSIDTYDETNEGKATINYDKKTGTYRITINDVEDLQNNDTESDLKTNESGVTKTQFEIEIKTASPEIEAELEWVNDENITYKQWTPKGNINNIDKPGNEAKFKIILKNKIDNTKNTTTSYTVRTRLSNVSNQPGICLNYPLDNANHELDFKFYKPTMPLITNSYTATEVLTNKISGGSYIVIVNSFDFGATAALTVEVTLNNGKILIAKLPDESSEKILLPYRKNETTKIAYELRVDEELKDTDDNEKQNGNENNGDGYSKYEEYRGFVVNGKHKRLDPLKKDLLVFNTDGRDLSEAYGLFTSASQIKIIELKLETEYNRIKKTAKVNKGYAYLQDQCGVIIELTNGIIAGDTECAGATYPEGYIASPGKAEKAVIKTNPKITQDNFFNVAVAHEIAHACGVIHHGKLETSDKKDSSLLKYIFLGDPTIYNFAQVKDAFIATYNSTYSKGTMASGNVSCIMIYNKVAVYGYGKFDSKTTYQSPLIRLIENGKVNYKYSNIVQNIFCTDKIGTGYNAEGGDNIFGNAMNGNCMSQFQVKDK